MTRRDAAERQPEPASADSSAPGSRARPRRGDLVEGRYLLERLLGEGGMGEVWAARHVALDRPVALKIVLIDAPSTRERLLREARALATLKHPTIVEVFDFGELRNGTPYIVMELLEGESLDALLRREGPLEAEDAVRMLLPVLDGLELAHGRGIIHRDIKPANVFLHGPADGAVRVARLLDFGIAFIARSGASRITTSGGIVGTPSYMAPEQFRGREVDPRTDIWGVGVTLYECLTGELPFGSGDPFAVMAKVLGRSLEPPENARGLDDALWEILTRALAKASDDRFPSAAALGGALAAWLDARSRAMSHAATLASTPPPRSAAIVPPRGAIAAFEGRPDDDELPSMDALIRSKFAGS